MMRIAIDFDEVLFPTLDKVVEVYNKRRGTNIELSQITTYSLYDSFPADIADELLELFVDKTVYDNLQPYKGATRAVQTLIERGNEIYVATATDVRNMEWKEELLRRYFPFIPKNNLIRIHNKKLLNVDILIEDNLDNLTQTFADRICFDQPWNRDDVKDFSYEIYRIKGWGEVVETINNIERSRREWEK